MRVGDTEVPLGTPKQRAVLAMLVINRNRPVSVDSLLGAAWEQWPPSGARASLHSYVSNLRRLIGGGVADARTVLASAPPGYRLYAREIDCDIGRFVIGKNAGVQAAAEGHFEEASRRLAAALAEWRGPVLEDLRQFPFVDAFATALAEDKIVAHTARVEAEIACGRAYAVIGQLEMLAAEHPYHEPLWAQLITAYYLSERQSEALGAFSRLKAVLAGDLGVDPGPRVRELQAKILRQEPLDVKKAAMRTAERAVTSMQLRTVGHPEMAAALLRDASRRSYSLCAAATTIGRLADNDIVVDDASVSRHHAVIVDTGTNFVISDLRSANGVWVRQQRIRGSAVLADGDRIGISGHEFTLEIGPRPSDSA
jgi:SARP family transcriptional regulator, regulator of embCAB operon